MDIEELANTSVITIVLDGQGKPMVDLGRVSPIHAAWVFRSVLVSLEEMAAIPQITYGDEVIYDCAPVDPD